MDESAYREAIATFNQSFIKHAITGRILENPHCSVVILSPEGEGGKKTVSRAAGAGPVTVKAVGMAGSSAATPSPSIGLPGSGAATPFPSVGLCAPHGSAPVSPPSYKASKAGGIKFIHTQMDTHGISSMHLYLDASKLPQPLIGYAQILAHTFADPGSLPPGLAIGDIQGHMSADKDMRGGSFTPRMHLTLRGLDSDAPSMAHAAACLLDPSKLPSKPIVRNYLARAKLSMENAFENQMPLSSCLARLSDSGLYDYEINGPNYYQFVCGVLSDFDNVWPSVRENLAEAKRALMGGEGAVLSFTGADAPYKQFKKESSALTRLFSKKRKEESCPVAYFAAYSLPAPIVSVFPAPLSQTHAVVQGGSLAEAGAEYNGAFLVTASLLNYDYLWPLVRDEGGAYGVNVSVIHDGSVFLRSYRDPNCGKTFEAYKGIPEFLRKPVSDEDFEGVRAHALSEWDEQFQPYRMWDYGAKVELGIIDPALIARVRKEIVYSLPGDLVCDADIWEKILKQGVTAVGGKRCA